ncbi:hypothetical protein ACFL4T_09270 [candidate division KSB1 bacterium]
MYSKRVLAAILILSILLTVNIQDIYSQGRPSGPKTILPEKLVNDLINELSGSLALNHIIELGAYNRDRLKSEYEGTYWESEYTEKMAKFYGLSDVHIEKLEGLKIFGAKQWDAEVGELWLVGPDGEKLIISHRDEPACLAGGSKTADVTADLVFAGDGTKQKDYENIDVTGKIVLATGAGGSWGGSMAQTYRWAVREKGALGVICFKNLKPFENPDQIPWAGISGFGGTEVKEGTFGFNLPHKIGYKLMERLLKGDKIKVRANVKTASYETDEEIPTAVIPGKSKEEVVYTAHLFEGVTKQGAIDDFSGCAVLLDVGRTLVKMIAEGKLPQPETENLVRITGTG